MTGRERILNGYAERKRQKHAETELLVHLDSSAAPELRRLGCHIGEHLANTDYTVVALPRGWTVDRAVERLCDIPGVRDIELNHIFGAVPAAPNDPYFTAQINCLQRLDVSGMWDLFARFSGTVHHPAVAVLDVGFDTAQEDLAGQFLLPGYNAYDETANVNPPTNFLGQEYHGTRVAGVIAAVNNNSRGIAGLAFNSRIFPVRLRNNDGDTSDLALIRGVNQAAASGCRVINISSYASASNVMRQATDSAKARGCVICASAGNRDQLAGPFDQGNPICLLPSVYGVSGLDLNANTVHDNSCYFDGTAFCASYYVYTMSGSAVYGQHQGTSYCAPQLSSLAAQMLAFNDSLSVDDVISIMADNCVPESPPVGSPRRGHGIPQFTGTLKDVMGAGGIWGGGRRIKRMTYGDQNIAAVYYCKPNGKLKKIWNPETP